MNRTHSWRFCRPPPSHLATSAWVGGFLHRTFQINVSDLGLRIDLRTDSTVNSAVGAVDTVFKFLIWMNLVQRYAVHFSTARHFVNQLLPLFGDIIHIRHVRLELTLSSNQILSLAGLPIPPVAVTQFLNQIY